MEIFSLTFFIIMVPAVIFAGISKGGFGSGAAFASASILALVLDPGAALGIMLPLLMLIDVASLPAYWKKWDWPAAKVLLIGAVPGTVLGAAFFAISNPDVIRFLIGLISLLFVAWQLARSAGWLQLTAKFGQKAGLISGVALGFTSFVSHAGGPAAAVFLLGQGLAKTPYQATTVLVFWAVNFMKSFIYAGMGIFTFETLKLDLALAPFAVLGTLIGVKLHHMVPEKAFFALTYVLLSMTGFRLIWTSLA